MKNYLQDTGQLEDGYTTEEKNILLSATTAKTVHKSFGKMGRNEPEKK